MAACNSLCPLHQWCDQYRAQVPQPADEIQVGTLISRQARRPQGIESSIIMAGWETAWRTMAGIECIKRLKMQMWIHSIFLGQQPLWATLPMMAVGFLWRQGARVARTGNDPHTSVWREKLCHCELMESYFILSKSVHHFKLFNIYLIPPKNCPSLEINFM